MMCEVLIILKREDESGCVIAQDYNCDYTGAANKGGGPGNITGQCAWGE